MNTTQKQGRVPFISKFAYGMGDVGCNFSWMFVRDRKSVGRERVC